MAADIVKVSCFEIVTTYSTCVFSESNFIIWLIMVMDPDFSPRMT
jgi:hypothetical protein